MKLSPEQLDALTAGYKTPEEMETLYSQMLQHMINRSLEAEMQAHLGHERYGTAGGNPRNGKTRKRVQSAVGALEIETRSGSGSRIGVRSCLLPPFPLNLPSP